MLAIVIVMFGGICCGYVFRHRNLDWTGRSITAAIWCLLFLLGVSVGSNRDILDHLDTIGFQALVLGLAGVLGSGVLAALVYRLFFSGKGRGEKE